MAEDERRPDSGDDEGSESSDRATDPDPREEESDIKGAETDAQPETGTGLGEDIGQSGESDKSDESGFDQADTKQLDESEESSSWREDTRQPDESGEPGGSGFGREESRTRQGQGPETGRASAGTGGRETQQPAGAQGSGTGRPAATRGEAGAGPPGRETAQRQGNQTGGVTDAISERIRQFNTVIVWPESLIAGIGAWLVGFLLTAVPLWWFDFGDGTDESILDISIWVYIESVGGSINGDTLAVTIGGVSSLASPTPATDGIAYGTLESNAFGLGAVLHGFVPMLVLIIAGYILAGRQIKAGTTERPLQSVLAGGSLAVWFTLTLFLAAVVSSSGEFSVNLLETLVVTLLYTGVLASIGATIRSRTGLTSVWGLLAGIGAFAVGLLAWRFIDNPFENRPSVDGITDLEGLLEYTRLLTGFVSEHGVGADEILPTWFAAVVPLLFGGLLALAYRRRDPVVGFGEGARLGTTYALVVFVAVVANIGAQAQEYEEQGGGWSDGQIEFVNQLIASAPRDILFAGIVYPVVFAAIGGAIGATAYDLWQSSNEESRQQTGQPRREPAGSAAGGYRQEQGRQASQQYQQSTGPGQQTPDRSEQRPPEGAGDGYRAGEQSSGRTDNQYRSGQQTSGRAEGSSDRYQSDRGRADRGRSVDDTDRSEGRETTSDTSGEELSPGDILGDELDEDDTGDS